MNREKAIRLKFYEILNGQLTYELAEVPVWDAKLEDDQNNVYVILTEQSARIIEKFSQKSWECYQTMSIYAIQEDSVSRDVVDDVCEQIEALCYQALENGVEYEGWQLNNVSLFNADHRMFELGESKSQILKEIVFRLEATKTSSY